jgi:hypothetical protein
MATIYDVQILEPRISDESSCDDRALAGALGGIEEERIKLIRHDLS